MLVLDNHQQIPLVEFMKVFKPMMVEGYRLSIQPRGDSMRPFIRNGKDIVVLKSAAGIKLKRGDIIFYRSLYNESMVLHRIHHIKDGCFYPVGDAHIGVECAIRPENVYGVVCEFERNGKRISADAPLYRTLVQIWLLVIRLRPFAFKAWRAIRRVTRRQQRSRN